MRQRVTVVIPCYNNADFIRDTVQALLHEPGVDELVVVDDGSTDDSADEAEEAGAIVIRLDKNQGKAAALRAAIDRTPATDIYLFIDADTQESAQRAIHLLPPVLSYEADMTIGVLPSVGSKGGFGLVKRFAGWGIKRATGVEMNAPLSGQRAIRAELLREIMADFGLAPRFGVEVGLTIDALKRNASVFEVDVDMSHEPGGRGFDGFKHRALQGKDVLRALWFRSIPLWTRSIPLAVVTLVMLAVCGIASSHHSQVRGASLPHADNVDVVLVPDSNWKTIDPNSLSGGLGSVVTGNTKDVFNSVAAGSRDKNAVRSPDVNIKVATVTPPPSSTPTIVAAFTSNGSQPALRPIAIEGAGLSGTLTSPSTRRSGIVDITDIAPTVLAMEGKPIPAGMTGTPMRLLDHETSPSTFVAVDKMSRFYDHFESGLIWAYTLFQVGAFLLALYVSRRNKEIPYANWVAAAVAAFPMATYFTRWFWGTYPIATPAWSATCALIVGIIVFMSGAGSPRTFFGLRRILPATVMLICADVLLGAKLQFSGIFGSSPLIGARYHGLGNPATELLLLATILWCGIHIQRTRFRVDATLQSAAVLLVVTVIVGAPGLGDDVGGLFTMVITSIGLVAALLLGRLTWRWVIASGGLALLALVAAAVIDYQRAADQRTHLGRLVARVMHEGVSPLWDTVWRKVDNNVFAYGFPWSLGVIAIVGYMLVGLLRGKWTETFPIASPQRFALIAALCGSFVGYAVNDSGIVVLALVAVFVGPYVLVEYRLKRTGFEGTGSKLEVVVP